MTEEKTKEPTGFHVPPDLADSDLTLTQIRDIVGIRRRARVIQARVDAIPAKVEQMQTELQALRTGEATIKSGQPWPGDEVSTGDPVGGETAG